MIIFLSCTSHNSYKLFKVSDKLTNMDSVFVLIEIKYNDSRIKKNGLNSNLIKRSIENKLKHMGLSIDINKSKTKDMSIFHFQITIQKIISDYYSFKIGSQILQNASTRDRLWYKNISGKSQLLYLKEELSRGIDIILENFFHTYNISNKKDL